MSQETVEAAKAQYERWNAGDIDAWIDGFHPVAEYVSSVTEGLFGQGEYHGHEGLQRFVSQYLEAWEYFKLEPFEYIPVDDRVVVLMRAIGRGRGSGVIVESELAHVWTMRDGLAIRHQSYPTRTEAFEAVGLSE
jgi:ketosteroid isomerase-like protein